MSIKATQAFQRQIYLFAAGLAGLCLLLMFLTWLQGTRVRLATIDVTKVTQQGNQRLLLQLNQSSGAINTKDITITPKAAFSATSGGKTIAIQFTHPLRNDTSYQLHVTTSSGRHTSYSFKTSTGSFFYVVNVPGGSEIHERWLGTNKDNLVLSSEPIDDYIVLGNTFVYTVNDQAGRSTLYLFNSTKRERKRLPLPENGSIKKLRGAPDGKSFGFLFIASDYGSNRDSTICIYNFDTSTFGQVSGFDSRPFRAVEWQFARNSKTVVALGTDSTLFLINPGTVPTPFGQYSDIGGFTYDDSSVLVSGRGGAREVLNLKNGQRTPVPELSADSYTLTSTPLNTEAGSVLRVQVYAGNESTGKVITNRGDTSKQTYSAGSDMGYIAFNTLSQNDQYVAIELRNTNTEATTIEIIDTWSSKVITKLSGNKVRWTVTP